ncbi:MAG: single-stranded DNA-binding protein [Crocosphaera sp.]|nr:single-stranded DNA-binding protein [Crocosphaera sp.]
MNSCVLMAKVISNPELRYTSDTQTEVAQMLVEFEGRRKEDPCCTLKVVGWGGLATQMKETCAEGDRLIIEGRLSMNTFERKEGFKEKRAELVVSRLYSLNGIDNSGDNVVSFDAAKESKKSHSSYDENDYDLDESATTTTSSSSDADDPIPF